ncbi:MAG: MinD/ParA family protein [Selenomonadaceae bacterium]|nr:MinD/ParA family protein [Selenomonadaceae bacterium]
MTDQASTLRKLFIARAEQQAQERKIGGLDFDMNEETRVIAITSGKGGVGKTNLAVNLAVALQKTGKKVMLIDADIGMANVNLLMGSVTKHSLLDLLNEEVELEDVVENGIAGVKYISGVAGIESTLRLDRAEQQKLHQKLSRCSEMADTIIIDTGAGLNRNIIEFILASGEVLLVTTPEPTAIANAYAVIKAYSTYANKLNMRLIINRVNEENEGLAVAGKINQTAKRFLGITVNYLGYIYEDGAVTAAVRKQNPFVLGNADSPAARCILEIAKSLLRGSKMTKVKKGWRSFINRLFGY